MATQQSNESGLPREARRLIWKIFGIGQSPLTGRSTLDMIDQVLSEEIASATTRDSAIAIVRDWIETVGERQYIKPDKQELVAKLIFDGFDDDRSGYAIWAIGSIDRSVSIEVMRSNWDEKEIESFVEEAMSQLEEASYRDKVLSATGTHSLAGDAAFQSEISRSSIVGEGRLGSFQHLSNYGFELIEFALHPPIANLIELVVDLQPEKLGVLIERVDHPIMQVRATQHRFGKSRKNNHREPLQWIAEDSCDAMIALSVLHTLETVNLLDNDNRFIARNPEVPYQWSTELQAPQDDLEGAASSLIADLITRLVTLDMSRRVEWIGELLSCANSTLDQSGFHQSRRSALLESSCIEQLARIAEEEWSDDLIEAYYCGLRNTRKSTWTRHLTVLAWFIRDDHPDLATALAKKALEEVDGWIGEQMANQQLHWEDWECEKWITGLGAALALTIGDSDQLSWVVSRCRNLPLTAWDAEEDLQSFMSADSAAQLLLLVALHTVQFVNENKGHVDGSVVIALVEAAWNHCEFAGQYINEDRESSVVAEYAARAAIIFGNPSERWLMNQASTTRTGPRALWALIDQLFERRKHARLLNNDDDKSFDREFEHAASDRFGDGDTFGFVPLQYWGSLWLLLRSSELAKKTATAMFSFPTRIFDRNSKILVLDLLCMNADTTRMDRETMNRVESAYRDLWPTVGYTPENEHEDRQRIDHILDKQGISFY